jgi:hypothetical protein
MKPDIIVSWPKNCDYPLWRKFISKERDRFNEVIIIITETGDDLDFTGFVADQLDWCRVYVSRKLYPNEDWRNVAVNKGLELSKNDWVWFTEQDFLPEEGFWDEVRKQKDKCGVISYYQQDRMHPCCIFAKRKIIEKTRKDFGIVPDVLDHFGLFQEDIDTLYYADKIELGYITKCKHMEGLSHNFNLISRGIMPTFKPKEFREYLLECLGSGVLDKRFVDIVRRYLDIN